MSRACLVSAVSLLVGIGVTHGAARLFDGNGAEVAGAAPPQEQHQMQVKEVRPMRLGNFSVSLSVKDIAASRAFYEKLGFTVFGGDQDQNWLIMQNESATIGLFQGMFPRNTLTFNPGWDRSAQPVADFDDVREIQALLRARGIEPAPPADETSTGPAYIMLTDPDGNPILLDQHVSKPGA
ncbi:MAG: VOC family protein [Phycisphaeraceae bacterium]|nr:VOC family protein [Phycisphaeraceae bacterium]